MTMPTPHDAFAERLLDLAYGELPPREAREVEGHAASCEACRTDLRRIRETRRLMAALPEEPAPEAGERILLAAAREAAERRTRRRLVPRWLLGTAAVAASLVVVAAVSYRLVFMPPEGEPLAGERPYPPHANAPAARPDTAPQGAVEAFGEPAEPAAPLPATPAPSRSPPPAPERKRAVPPRDERPPRALAEAPPAGGAELHAEAAPAAPAPGAVRAEDRAPGPALEQEAQLPSSRAGAAAKAAEAPAVARLRAPAFAAPLRAEVRSFERCEGESRRTVEADAQGRVARYVREGTIAGRRVRITHTYRPDGGLAAVAAVDLDAGGAAVDVRALGIDVPERAGEARIDAPPRCGR